MKVKKTQFGTSKNWKRELKTKAGGGNRKGPYTRQNLGVTRRREHGKPKR